MVPPASTYLHLRDDVTVVDPTTCVERYRDTVTWGPTYYERARADGGDQIRFGDLAWAVLLVGQPRPRAAHALLTAEPIDISSAPTDPLHELGTAARTRVVDAIMRLIALDGFASAVATKVLHPKRAASVPVLDNRAIFGSFLRDDFQPGMSPRSPGSAWSRAAVTGALDAVHHAVSRADNEEAWASLEASYEGFTRVELFDMVWWTVTRPSLVAPSGTGAWRVAAP